MSEYNEMPTQLKSGGGATTQNACVMNAVHALMQLKFLGDIKFTLTDQPPCTDQWITYFAIKVNDTIQGELRQALLFLVEELYLAHPIKSEEARARWEKIRDEWAEAHLPPEEEQSEYMRDILSGEVGKDRFWYVSPEEEKAARIKVEREGVIRDAVLDGLSDEEKIDKLIELLNLYDKVRADEGVLHEEVEWEEDEELVPLDEYLEEQEREAS